MYSAGGIPQRHHYHPFTGALPLHCIRNGIHNLSDRMSTFKRTTTERLKPLSIHVRMPIKERRNRLFAL